MQAGQLELLELLLGLEQLWKMEWLAELLQLEQAQTD